MLKVKTTVKNSDIHGLGLFADEFIPKGTVTWQYESKFDTGFTQEEIDSLPETAKQFMLYYCYFDKELQKYILCSDNQRYINHSNTSTNINSTPRQDVAARDIQAGEEFLCDYVKFDDQYFSRLGLNVSDLK